MGYALLKNVSVEIPVYNSHSRSFKRSLVNMATGGMIGTTEKGVTCVRSLQDINLEVNPHERLGLIGHNGAGKTTMLRVFGRVYAPTKGTATIEGSISSLIGLSLGIDSEATGVENIYLRAALMGIPKKLVDEELENIIDFSELGEFINMPVRTYSTGMKMRLAFSISTVISPDILLMDEWLSVGDASFKQKAESRLNSVIERSNILVIASHSRGLIERCCTRVVWLDHGRIKMDGKPKEVCAKFFK